MITVRAKITAGVHPVHGPIVEGQIYTIEESQFADQLFERVETDHQPPAAAKATTGKSKRR